MSSPINCCETPVPAPIPERIAAVLRCLSCRGLLARAGPDLTCTSCGAVYPWRNGTYKFVAAEHYAESFGFEWRKHATTQLDSESSRQSEESFRSKTGWSPQDLRGKLVLDVGCGMGRYAEVATRWGATVVGVDLSVACEVAAANLRDRSASFLQADLFSLPFEPETFDYIYSIGVLHHTPSCEQAFKALPQYLKPVGQIAIWLYSRYNPCYRFSDFYRKFTPHLPLRILYGLCQGLSLLHYLHAGLRAIPWLGRRMSGALQLLLPISPDPRYAWRVLDTFDWYSPVYQSKHTYEEVFRWFESCGLQARVMNEPIAVQGTKPSSS